ncbi:glycosyltransferase [Massilia sp. BSC265]|uniref:glycosyltransferase n=1 Tax=Massilia sp. BSC265 TaxID=1549812 RepID=UPI0006916CB8|nr:glycosyltransferase [Massilia sp. BSC265]
MRIVAVVVTRDRPKLLQQVLAALQSQHRPPEHVIVVDNGSGPETGAVLACWPRLEVLRPGGNLGGAGGFALGMRHALAGGCDWIWLLDDDAVPRADALARLAKALLLQAGAGMAPGAVAPAVFEFGGLALAHRRRYNLFSGIERMIAPAHYCRAAVPVDTASFVGLLVSARAAAACGLPDAALFLSYDDTEYCLRLRRAGWPLWLVPGSIIDHLRSPAGRMRAGPIGSRHYYNLRNRVVVARRHARLPLLAGTVATLTGVGLWLGCRGRFRKGAWRIVRQALADGWIGRLGPCPVVLDEGPVGTAPAPVPAASRERTLKDDWRRTR